MIRKRSFSSEAETAFVELPVLPPIESADFDSVFQAKLNQCSIRCDFGPNGTDPSARRLKTRDLTDILRMIDTYQDARRLRPEQVSAVVAMARANLERPLAPIDRRYLITDDVQPFIDGEWEHVGIVYQILRRLQEIRGRCEELDIGFLRMILKQIGSCDERAQTPILAIVQQYCAQRKPAPFYSVFAALAAELLIWESSPNYMFAALSALLIATAIVREYPASLKFIGPMLDRVVPLLTAPNFVFFRHAFFDFAVTLLEGDTHFGVKLLGLAVQFWPTNETAKQISFFKLFALVIPRLSARQFSPIVPRILRVIASSIESLSSRVAEAAFLFLTDRGMDFLVRGNPRAVITAVCAPIRQAAAMHWNADIRQQAERATTKLMKLDPPLWAEVSASGRASKDNQKLHAWFQIAGAAARNGYQLGKKCGDIAKLFGGAASPPEVGMAEKRPARRSNPMVVQLPFTRGASRSGSPGRWPPHSDRSLLV
jgi:serine/threonine-protein phosphatase 2A regulatory subunit B'